MLIHVHVGITTSKVAKEIETDAIELHNNGTKVARFHHSSVK